MRIILAFGLAICLFLSGCEYLIPNTSIAVSQYRQMDELQIQTQQLERQADALETLADEVGTNEINTNEINDGSASDDDVASPQN